VPELPRLRLSSIDSIEADPALMECMGEPRLMPHLHLSLQSGDDMILKRMKRRHLRDDAIRFCDDVRARRPDVVFGADLIAGFPTETDAMHRQSLAMLEDCGLTWLHIFPYSPRKGTPAAKMPAVDGGTIKARAAELRAAGEARRAAYLQSRIGQRERVLVERGDMGRTESFAEIRFAEPRTQGDIIDVTVTGSDGGHLTA